MKVDFQRLQWKNYPSTDTPLNADNLNRLEEGVAGLYSDLEDVANSVETLDNQVAMAENSIDQANNAISDFSDDLAGVTTELSRGVLQFTNVPVSATTGDIATINNSLITNKHVVVSAVWGNSSYITTDVTCTSSAGRLVLNGTCTTATTVDLILAEKKN